MTWVDSTSRHQACFSGRRSFGIHKPLKEIRIMSRTIARFSVVAITTAVAACTHSSPNAGGRQVTFQVATKAATAAPAPGGNLVAPETITVGSDVLVINQVQLVLREIEFERQNHDACDT